ncbi:Beta-hexosaminidase [Pseudoalteromonas luteoviolacea B = ATCC 29581]|nr:Beta-hexosaminidase [Pseudoalteromonas luteoviolacea B = ATCC 29581]
MNRKLIMFFSLLFFSVSLAATSQFPLMPMPKHLTWSQGALRLGTTLSIEINGMAAQRKQFQLARFSRHLSNVINQPVTIVAHSKTSSNIVINIRTAEQHVTTPQFGEDESYQLVINEQGVYIDADTVFGAQHALTTLVQLIQATPVGESQFSLPFVTIDDKPRFSWRGLLIDSSRHFLSVSTIKRQLEGMAAAKLNVLHWHLTDDQGWRIESKQFPHLTQKASDGQYYTQIQIAEIVDYARYLGIRILPEIGMPGHASAIAVAYPNLMTKAMHYEMERQWGVFEPLLDIADPQVYEFIDVLLGEMTSLFPDNFFHIGGDEVEATHWLEDDEIQKLMQKRGFNNARDLQNHFNTKLQAIVSKHKRTMVGWDEIFHPDLPSETTVQSWRGHESLNTIARAGYKGILSTGFYIDQPQYTDYHYRNDPLKEALQPPVSLTHSPLSTKAIEIERLKGSKVEGELLLFKEFALIRLNSGLHQQAQVSTLARHNQTVIKVAVDSWMGPLSFEVDLTHNEGFVLIGNSRYPLKVSEIVTPSTIRLAKTLSRDDRARILGAEATIWTELVNDENIDVRIWPRLFAIAERVWSPAEINDSESMYERLAKVSNHGHQIIGLKHIAQQQQGFQALLSDTLDKQAKLQSIGLLNLIATLVEPSHYYTRHHIKYLNNQYHQRAPLRDFVDFLPVESAGIRVIRRLVSAYVKGDARAIHILSQHIEQWQREMKAHHIAMKNQKIVHLESVLTRLMKFLEYSALIVQQCNAQKSQIPRLDDSLLQLQSLTDELVIAGIYPMRELYFHCTKRLQ